MAIFPGGPGLAGTRNVSVLDFIGANDDGGGDDNWSYKSFEAPVRSSPPTNQHPAFYRPDALSVTQPTASEHCCCSKFIYIMPVRNSSKSVKVCQSYRQEFILSRLYGITMLGILIVSRLLTICSFNKCRLWCSEHVMVAVS